MVVLTANHKGTDPRGLKDFKFVHIKWDRERAILDLIIYAKSKVEITDEGKSLSGCTTSGASSTSHNGRLTMQYE